MPKLQDLGTKVVIPPQDVLPTISQHMLADGEHRVRALADGRKIGEARFRVTRLGSGYLRGVSGSYNLPDFPHAGNRTRVQWEEALQNFVITGVTPGATPVGAAPPAAPAPDGQAPTAARLENPQPGSFQSGIAVISGWACDAERIDIEFDQRIRLQAAYGTSRKDTQGVCGDADNGFGLLFSMNILGDGVHQVRVLADDREVARADFSVATFGVGYLRGVTGSYRIDDFPRPGEGVTLKWEEDQQNFVISEHRTPPVKR